jgi:GntR family transcriptional regulator
MSTAKSSLAKQNAAPLYAQVTNALRHQLKAETWKPGAQLPTEPALGDRFGVSSITIRRALATLEDEGLLVRRQGRGTFAAERHELVVKPYRLSSLTDDFEQRGWSSTSRMVRHELILPTAEIANLLGIGEEAEVVLISRIRLADGEPLAIQTAWLPSDLFPGLAAVETLDKESLYAVLARRYSTAPTRAHETLQASTSDEAESTALAICEGDPIFRVQRVTREKSERVIEVVQSAIRGDRYTLAIDLQTDM